MSERHYTALTVGSLFTGLGGIDLACERAGMRVAWQCEIDEQCRGVLARHWPNMRCYEDVRTISHRAPVVDVLAGGFPCQDLSVAGNRAGLAGERSGLWWQFRRLVAELTPTWVLIENVFGLLSSAGGRDMGTVLGSLGQLGYWWAYRVLDAQFAGVPQRRRRVFIVGHSGDRRAPATVLFEPESLCRDTPPRRQAREDVAGSLRASAASRGYNDSGDTGVNLIAHALSTRDYKRLTRGGEPVNLIAHTLRAEGHDASEDGTGRGVPILPFDTTQICSKANFSNPKPGDPCHPLTATAHPPAIAFDWRSAGDVRLGIREEQVNALHSSQAPAAMVGGLAVRRLTPRECERLMGLPDDWTALYADGTPVSDSARYRMLGNSVAVPAVEWIARRIVAYKEAA